VTQDVPEIQAVIRSLTDWLGPRLMGEMCGMVGSVPLKKWLVKPPNVEEEGKLRTGYAAFRLIRNAEGVDIARAWMVGMNPHLDDRNPLTEIGLGHGRDVMMAARAYLHDPMSN
jgi:hypothetical protein